MELSNNFFHFFSDFLPILDKQKLLWYNTYEKLQGEKK